MLVLVYQQIGGGKLGDLIAKNKQTLKVGSKATTMLVDLAVVDKAFLALQEGTADARHRDLLEAD